MLPNGAVIRVQSSRRGVWTRRHNQRPAVGKRLCAVLKNAGNKHNKICGPSIKKPASIEAGFFLGRIILIKKGNYGFGQEAGF